MTAEIYAEFLRTLAISWACFAIGAALWHWRAWATFAGLQHCSKLLLLLSPVLLSAFGYRSTEAVRTVEMTSEGGSIAAQEFDSRQVPVVRWSSQRNGTSDRQFANNSGRTITGVVGMQARPDIAGHGIRWFAGAPTQHNRAD